MYNITYRMKSPHCVFSWQSFSATQSRSSSCQVSFTVTAALDLLTYDTTSSGSSCSSGCACLRVFAALSCLHEPCGEPPCVPQHSAGRHCRSEVWRRAAGGQIVAAAPPGVTRRPLCWTGVPADVPSRDGAPGAELQSCRDPAPCWQVKCC